MTKFLRTLGNFKRSKRRSPIGTFSKAGGAVAYSETLSPATYTVTAAQLSPVAKRQVALSATSYTVTAASLTTVLSRKAVFSAASYAVTASSLAVVANRSAALSAASYALTGASLASTAGRVVALSSASYSFTASSLATLVTRNVTLSRASFAFTGSNLDVVVTAASNYAVELTAASFALTGSSLAAQTARSVDIDPASYAVTAASLDAVYAPGAGAANYTATLSPAAYAFTGASLTATSSVVVVPETPAQVGGGGGPAAAFYRGRHRLEVRKAIRQAISELSETRTPRARKRKARRVVQQIVVDFAVAEIAPLVIEQVPPRFAELEGLRKQIFDLSLQLREKEAVNAQNAAQLQRLFQEYEAESKRLDQREEEEAIMILMAMAA